MFLFHSFTSGWPVFPAPLVKEMAFNPLYILDSFVKYKVFKVAWIFLWAFYFVPLIYIFVFVLVPYCLDDCVFVVDSEVRQVDSSSSILLSQDCFGYSRCFVFPYKLWNIICSSSVKNTVGNLIGIAVLLAHSELFCLRVLFGKPGIIIRAVVSSDTEGKTTNIPN